MPGAKFLEGDKVNLRTIEEDDLQFLRDNVNNPRVGKNIVPEFKPRNMEQQEGFFEEVICSEESVHLAICSDKEIKGIVSLNPQAEGVGKIGLWVAEEFQGEGFGTEASELLIDYAFKQLRHHRILARTLKTNKASQRLWEKHGFEKEGEFREQIYRDGEFRNLILYGLLRSEWNE